MTKNVWHNIMKRPVQLCGVLVFCFLALLLHSWNWIGIGGTNGESEVTMRIW